MIFLEGLRDWMADDDPWIEHSRWSKNCSFIIETKGREFVETVQLAVQYSQLVSKAIAIFCAFELVLWQ